MTELRCKAQELHAIGIDQLEVVVSLRNVVPTLQLSHAEQSIHSAMQSLATIANTPNAFQFGVSTSHGLPKPIAPTLSPPRRGDADSNELVQSVFRHSRKALTDPPNTAKSTPLTPPAGPIASVFGFRPIGSAKPNHDTRGAQQRLASAAVVSPFHSVSKMPNFAATVKPSATGTAGLNTTVEIDEMVAAVEAKLRSDRYSRGFDSASNSPPQELEGIPLDDSHKNSSQPLTHSQRLLKQFQRVRRCLRDAQVGRQTVLMQSLLESLRQIREEAGAHGFGEVEAALASDGELNGLL
jgi:hypothetical protein